ncbi:hypothetical protein M5K25_013722 [Dendrobium thyrsiflorum]|uniref:Uncharacterized protein n=1 Tax=Dendrobium thyrsiflorum TaxID=117978 RepID=A0ABD0UU37_DENTH
MTYLGVKLALMRLVLSDLYNLLKAYSRLNVWGNRFISLSGKLILLKSTFCSLPTFLSTHSLVPMGVLNDLDRIFYGTNKIIIKVSTMLHRKLYVKQEEWVIKECNQQLLKCYASPTWKILLDGDKFLHQIVRWKVSDGNCIITTKDAWILDKSIDRWPTFVAELDHERCMGCIKAAVVLRSRIGRSKSISALVSEKLIGNSVEDKN